MTDLDETDTALLKALQADGRASFESLGRLVGLSRIAARNRVQQLLDTGAVRVITVVHPATRGLEVLGHVSITVEREAAPVAEAMAEMEEFPLVSVVGGRHSIIAEVRTTGLPELRSATQAVRAIPGVRHVSTCVYTQRLKDRHSGQPPSPETTTTYLDDIDHRIVEALQRDGRATFAAIGKQVLLAPSTVRSRVLALIESGTVHIGATVRPGVLGLGHMTGFGLTAADSGTSLATLAELPEVHYLTECIGSWDAIGTLLCSSQQATAQALDHIRVAPGVHDVESWVHLQITKEDYTLPPVRTDI